MAVELRTQRVRHIKRWWQGGYFRMDERPAAETDLVPKPDSVHFYAADASGVSALFYRDDAGVEHSWGGAGGGPGGGVAIGDVITGGTAGDILLVGAGPVLAQETVATLNAALDHGALLGLGDDDHAQYALLAGRAGGQILKGGTAASETLTLFSTAHATKGKILFGTSAYDEVNNRLGIANSTPSAPLDVTGLTQTTTLIVTNASGGTTYFQNTNAASYVDFALVNDGGVSGRSEIYYTGSTWAGTEGINTLNINGQLSDLNLLTQSVIRLTVDKLGNIGIGTQAPRTKLSLVSPHPAPTTNTTVLEYLHLGGGEYTVNSYRMIGFGWNANPNVYSAAYIGYQEITDAGNTYGDLIFGTRSVTTDTQPSERLRITNAGNLLIGAAVAPSTGTLGLIFGDGTALATMASNTAGFYADSMGANVEMMSISESGSLRSLAWPRCVKVGTQFDKVDATLADVTNLTHNVNAGKSYDFEALLHVDASLVGGSKFAIAGTATATSIIYHIDLLDNTTNAHTITSRQTALAGSAGQAGTTAGLCRIIGTIVVNAAGTLTVQMAQNAANGTSSVLVNSSFTVDQLP